MRITEDVLVAAEATITNGTPDYKVVRKLVESRRVGCNAVVPCSRRRGLGGQCGCAAYLQASCYRHGGLTLNQTVMAIYDELRNRGSLPPLPEIPAERRV